MTLITRAKAAWGSVAAGETVAEGGVDVQPATRATAMTKRGKPRIAGEVPGVVISVRVRGVAQAACAWVQSEAAAERLLAPS